jgi:gas vesicle protein
MGNNGSGMKMFLSFLTGAALGAIVGVVLAPQSGKETRRKIREYSDKFSEDLKEEYGKVSGKAKTFAEEAKGRILETKEKLQRKGQPDNDEG